jgi:hypothetical protein
MTNMELSKIDNKDKKPFSHIYLELLTKTAPHYLFNPKYSPPPISLPAKLEDNYSYPNANNNQNNQKSDFSINSFLNQESDALGDKLKNSAFTIADRLHINTEFNYVMNNNWLYVRNKMLALGVDDKYNTNINNSDRRISALESQLVSIEKDILQEKQKCWSDLVKPSMYFLDLFQKYQSLKEDKKLLE